MIVAEAVGAALVDAGVTQAFGVVGSGNFHVTNACGRRVRVSSPLAMKAARRRWQTATRA